MINDHLPLKTTEFYDEDFSVNKFRNLMGLERIYIFYMHTGISGNSDVIKDQKKHAWLIGINGFGWDSDSFVASRHQMKAPVLVEQK